MKKILSILVLVLFFATPLYAFETTGFSNPYGVAVDPRTGDIFVSNMNGPGDAKNDNGFISKLSSDGKIVQKKFIDGISGLVELNAPKGMAVIGNFLYVADIEAIRVFDVTTAKSLFTVNFGKYPIKHFYDLTIGPDAALYVTDGPANTVYRIDVMKEHRVTVFIKDEALDQPHGLAWFSTRQLFLVGGWKAQNVFAFDKFGKRQPMPEISLPTIEGITVDSKGHVYIASTSMASIYRMALSGAIFPFINGVDSPIGMVAHQKNKKLLVVSYRRASLISYPLEN